MSKDLSVFVQEISDDFRQSSIGKALHTSLGTCHRALYQMLQIVSNMGKIRSHMPLGWMCRIVSDPTCSRLISRANVEIPTSDAAITCVVVFEKLISSSKSHDTPLIVAVGFSSGHLQIYSVDRPLPKTGLTGVWPQLSKSPRTDEKRVSLVLATRAHDAAVSKIMVDTCITFVCSKDEERDTTHQHAHTLFLSLSFCACASDISHRARATACMVSAQRWNTHIGVSTCKHSAPVGITRESIAGSLHVLHLPFQLCHHCRAAG